MKPSENWIYAKHFDLDVMTSLVQALLEHSTAEDIENGRNWYQIARQFCNQTAVNFNLKIETITAITSALSPANDWQTNKRDVIALLTSPENFTTSTYDNNKSKALKFYHGKLQPFVAYSQENWSKTSCFFDNILRPFASDVVTLDRHAARVCHGYHMTADDVIFYVNTRAKYIKTAEAYKIIAKRQNKQPSTVQATAWTTYKRLFVDKTAKDNSQNFNDIIL